MARPRRSPAASSATQRRDRAARQSLLGTVCWLLSSLAAASAAGAAGAPVKLAISDGAAEARVGAALVLQVGLVDGSGAAAALDREIEIALVVQGPQGRRSLGARLPAGRPAGRLTVTPDAVGIHRISAEHPELLAAERLLMVGAADTTAPLGDPPPLLWEVAPRLSPGPQPAPPDAVLRPSPPRPDSARAPRGAEPRKSTRSPGDRTRGNGLGGLRGGPLGGLLEPPTAAPRLTLRASPSRDLLADGRDSATIHAFVTDAGGAGADLMVQLHSSAGDLAPSVLRVPKGQFSAAAELTSERAGTVQIEFLASTPAAEIDGERRLQVAFRPPVVALEVSASPRETHLFGTAELVVRLINHQGLPTADEIPRQVSLALLSGAAQLEAADLQIPAGRAEARVRLQPELPGDVVVLASAANMLQVQARLRVAWPWLLLAATLAGGLIGGSIALFRAERRNYWRIGLGAVTGLVLYWALLFGALEWLPVALLNPFSAFAVAVVGGWLGTRVLEALAKRLGLSAPGGSAA